MISDTTNKISYACDGSQTSFPITFPFDNEGEIKVYIRNDTTKEESELNNPTDYTISGSNITTVDIWPSGYTLCIIRELPETQETDYREGDPLPAETLEKNVDRLTMMVQQLQEQMSRALLLPKTTPYKNLTHPEPEDNYFMIWKNNQLVNTQHFQDSNYVIQSFMKTFLESIDKGSAQSNLGISDFIKTLLNDVDAITAKTTLEIPNITVWNSQITYPIGAIVTYNGDIYIAVTQNINKRPDQNENDWEWYDPEFPGILKIYDGTGIYNADTRTEAIGYNANDTVPKRKGWYVCNGQSGTPDMRDRFIRSETTSGNIGGSDDAVIVNHNHTGATGAPNDNTTGTVSSNHRHQYQHANGTTHRGSSSNLAANNSWPTYWTGYIEHNHTHNMKSHTHSFTTSTVGVDGTKKNMPAYYSILFIKKVG